jgi:hypothetical protein
MSCAIVTILAMLPATGCTGASSEELSKVKADLEAVRAELSRIKAEQQALKGDLEKFRFVPRDDRAKVSLAVRFKSAEALTSINLQQEAFAALALDAAKVGDGEITKKCIGRLTSINQKEEVTYKSALRLAQAGEAEVALALARSLTSINQQQKALSKIAKGDYQE